MSVQDRFAVVTRGIEAVTQERAGCGEGQIRAALFAQTLCGESYTPTWLLPAAFSGESLVRRFHLKLLDAINEYLVKTTKSIRELAATLMAFAKYKVQRRALHRRQIRIFN